MGRQPREHVLPVGPRIVPVELRRSHKAHDGRGAFAGKLAATEEPCFSSHGPEADQILALFVIDRDTAIEQVLRERRPGVHAVVQSLGRRAPVQQAAQQVFRQNSGLVRQSRMWERAADDAWTNMKDPDLPEHKR